MYELNNKVRLIDMSDYDIQNSSEFLGFLSGVVSQEDDWKECISTVSLKFHG